VIVEKAAIAVRNLVELPNGRQAQMCKVVAKFLEVLLAQHLLLSFIWTPCHAGEFYNLLLLFAIESGPEASASRP
jgi:hypothetical protein